MLIKQKEITNYIEECLFRLLANFYNLFIYTFMYFSAHLPVIFIYLFFILKMYYV